MSREAKLKWRCRRGMRELDILLEGFLEEQFFALSPAERDAFELLLDCGNQELMAWFIDGESPEDDALADIVNRIRHGSGGKG